jgi:hypothetical protein
MQLFAHCPGARFGCRAEKGFRPLTLAGGSQHHPAGVAATGVSAGAGEDDRRDYSSANTHTAPPSGASGTSGK